MFLQMIRSQAGTLAKAGLEGVMNSIDSFFRMRQENLIMPERPTINVTLTSSRLRIYDNAIGFRSKEEILEVWEVFGRPHKEDANGFATDTKFGKFRIGRGQLFAFGRNTWRSNAFVMETDIEGRGREYILTTGATPVAGCDVTVDLYDSLSLREVQNTVDELVKFCRYVDVDLFVNGIRANTPPETLKWDVVTDQVYIRKTPSNKRYGGAGLAVYQQGVFVETIPAQEFGLEGTVVTRCEVSLNFARNQVLRRCPIWRGIARFLKVEGLTDVQRKKRLKSHEASNFVQEFSGTDGDVDYRAFSETACLPDVLGKMWSVKSISALPRSRAAKPSIRVTPEDRILIGFAPRHSDVATAAMQTRRALILDECLLEQLRVDETLPKADAQRRALAIIFDADKAAETAGLFHWKQIEWVDVDTLDDDDEDQGYVRLSPSDYTKREEMFVQRMNGLVYDLSYEAAGRDRTKMDRRRIGVGVSKSADAWTDADTYICFDREYVRDLQLSRETDWHKAGLLLARMFSYDAPSTDPEASDSVDFLQTYLTLSAEIPALARNSYATFRARILRHVGKLPKHMQTHLNQEAEAYAREQLELQDTMSSDEEAGTVDFQVVTEEEEEGIPS